MALKFIYHIIFLKASGKKRWARANLEIISHSSSVLKLFVDSKIQLGWGRFYRETPATLWNQMFECGQHTDCILCPASVTTPWLSGDCPVWRKRLQLESWEKGTTCNHHSQPQGVSIHIYCNKESKKKTNLPLHAEHNELAYCNIFAK